MTKIRIRDIESTLRNVMGDGVPVAFSHFDKPVELPFVTFITAGDPGAFADNKNSVKREDLVFELHTEDKDWDLEEKLETFLVSNSMPYRSTQSYIDEERMFLKIYETRMINL